MDPESMKQERRIGRSEVLTIAVIFAVLAVSVPVQYLVRRKVVVGMSSQHAHSHAHVVEEHEHAAEHEEDHVHQEEGHPASNIPLGSNLIDNYSFEVGTRSSIFGWLKKGEEGGALVYRDENRSYRGFASAAVSSQESPFVDAGWAMPLGALPLDHDLVFKGYIRTERLSGEAYLGMIVRGSAQEGGELNTLVIAHSDDLEGDNGWTPVELRCHVPPEAKEVWLECGMYGTGRAWFDELSLVMEERETRPQPGVNLLRNPSFEEGTRHWHCHISGFSGPPLYAVVPAAPGGSNALRIVNAPESGPGEITAFSQSVCGLRGEKGSLRLKGALRGESVDARAWVEAFALRASGPQGYMAAELGKGSTGWGSFELTLPLDGDTAGLFIRVNLEGGGTLYVADLELVFTPS